jgi:nucleotidyltransferase substrate binding protein (TIGR01987 family)
MIKRNPERAKAAKIRRGGSPMILDLSALDKALVSLKRAVVRSSPVPDDTELRDAVIQRFEYTYELCWKMLKRRIELDSPNPAAIDALPFRDLLREGAERGLIADVEKWMIYRDQRNITAHTYDERKALSVHRTAVAFVSDAVDLLEILKKRNG